MVVHISPIGRETKHVEEWLREITPVSKIWLIHSKKKDGGTDYGKNARDLEKKLKKDYAGIEVKRVTIDNPLGMDDTMDAITEIVRQEDDNNVIRQHVAINVTGGTNVMAAGAILSAMHLGTKAYYVLNREKNPAQKKYVIELPIPPIGIAKMNETQQKVLDIISKGYFILYDSTGRIAKEVRTEGPGVITNENLLKELGKDWNKTITSISGRTRKIGATKINAVAAKLEEKGYIEIIRGIPKISIIKLGSGRTAAGQEKIGGGTMYKITAAGKRQAKNSMMLKE